MLRPALAGHWPAAEGTQDEPLVPCHRNQTARGGAGSKVHGTGPGEGSPVGKPGARKGAAGGVVQGPGMRPGPGGRGDAEHPALGVPEAGWRAVLGTGREARWQGALLVVGTRGAGMSGPSSQGTRGKASPWARELQCKPRRTAVNPMRKPTCLVDGFVLQRNPRKGPPGLPREPPVAGLGQPPMSSHAQTLRRAQGAQGCNRGNPSRRSGPRTGAGTGAGPCLCSSHFLMYLLSTVLKLLLNSAPS